MSSQIATSQRHPVLFLGHGSPMNAIAQNTFTARLQSLGSSLERPRAILMVSAHWTTEGTWVTAMERPQTIYDFYGFPEPLYQVKYSAPGSPEVAQEIARAVRSTNVQLDESKWGLDHGTWSVLVHLFPRADIPVLQLSLDLRQPAEFHFKLGDELRALRSSGVLIVGSGNLVHNLRRISWDENAPSPTWALEFDHWLKTTIEKRDWRALKDDVLATEAGRLSVPTWEHYLPLLYILGASDSSDAFKFEFEGMQNASISMRSLRLG